MLLFSRTTQKLSVVDYSTRLWHARTFLPGLHTFQTFTAVLSRIAAFRLRRESGTCSPRLPYPHWPSGRGKKPLAPPTFPHISGARGPNGDDCSVRSRYSPPGCSPSGLIRPSHQGSAGLRLFHPGFLASGHPGACRRCRRRHMGHYAGRICTCKYSSSSRCAPSCRAMFPFRALSGSFPLPQGVDVPFEPGTQRRSIGTDLLRKPVNTPQTCFGEGCQGRQEDPGNPSTFGDGIVRPEASTHFARLCALDGVILISIHRDRYFFLLRDDAVPFPLTLRTAIEGRQGSGDGDPEPMAARTFDGSVSKVEMDCDECHTGLHLRSLP